MSIDTISNIVTGGIYCFKTKDDKKILYIGSSLKEANNRLSTHRSKLNKGLYTGTNKDILQKEYDNKLLKYI